jgi:hypothetical protein
MGEQYMTICGKGYVKINLDDFPELEGKSNSEINTWINDNADDLWVNWEGYIRKDNFVIYEEGELEEGEEPMIDDHAVPLWDYHNESEITWDKIKNEEKYFIYQD